MSMKWLFLGTMSGPCWYNVCPSFTLRPAGALIVSRLNHHDMRPMLMKCQFLGTMSGPCWDHVLPSFTYRLTRPKAHAYGVFIFGDHVRTMLVPELAWCYFQTS